MTVCDLFSLGVCLSVGRTGLHDCVWSVQSRHVFVCGTDWVTWLCVVCSVLACVCWRCWTAWTQSPASSWTPGRTTYWREQTTVSTWVSPRRNTPKSPCHSTRKPPHPWMLNDSKILVLIVTCAFGDVGSSLPPPPPPQPQKFPSIESG